MWNVVTFTSRIYTRWKTVSNRYWMGDQLVKFKPCVLFTGDVNAYIDENWQRFFQQIKPALDSYGHAFISYPIKAITNLVPYKKLFLP